MSFTLIDFFNGFQSLKANRKFSAGAQSTYFAILAKFNAAHYPATLPISTRDLQTDAGLKSVATAHECRNVLKNNKLIDFRTERGTTVYRLLTEHLPNTKHVSAEHLPNANRTAGGVFNSPAHEEAKTIDREKTASVSVCEGDVAKATKPQVSDTRTLPLSSPTDVDANAIHDEWAKAFGTPLTGNNALTLEQYAGTDYEKTQAAIAKTQAAKPRNPFAYFKTVYDAAEDVVKWQAQPTKKTAKIDDAANDELLKLIGGI